MLVQDADRLTSSPLQWKTVTETEVADELWDDVAFAWEMVRHVKSNAIVLAKDTSLIGVGAGQMSRVDSVEISPSTKRAIERAGSVSGVRRILSVSRFDRSRGRRRRRRGHSARRFAARSRSDRCLQQTRSADGDDRPTTLQTLMTILDDILVKRGRRSRPIERRRPAQELRPRSPTCPLSRFSRRAGRR